MSEIKIEEGWKAVLADELSSSHMKELKYFLKEQLSHKKVIYPPMNQIFNAFNFTPFEQVKVVIIGQDPYHGPGQAHGLCFSVQKNVPSPPSLKNIFKEIKSDIGDIELKHGCLTSWAEQGVLLLNSVLTVEAGKAGSHRNLGWEKFTDKVIEVLNHEKNNLVFLLWGNDAKKKGALVDRKKHYVLESAHPSPFSAHHFLGNKHFSKTNLYLADHDLPGIDWSLKE
ncbi:MAG: uracil-DNA glycosylase [Bacteriovoracaceae bacterium]|nr:uracil-DNA glycosylase [Bacteriovoracaceae bacterium]